jgi:DNA-binding MarR family transcriptional regulator/GNAT superfamily N-acetyltransferase
MDYLQNIGIIGINARLKRLSDSLSSQIGKIHKDQGIELEPRWFTVATLLNDEGRTSIQKLSEKLGISHPAVIQIVNGLKAKQYIKTEKGKDDRRMTYVELTDKGKSAYRDSKNNYEIIERSLEKLFSSKDYDVLDQLSILENAAGNNNLYNQVAETLKEKQMNEVKIIRYSKKYKNDFERLNTEWLHKYFTVETTDKKMLSYPEREIIKKGGEIFFALLDDKVVGTCAVIKIDKSTYELAKMAVTKEARGMQAGKKLGLTVIGFAISKGAKKVVLDTNTKLVAATNLYRKLGFIKMPYDYDDKYQRDLFRMELNLENV